MNFILDIFSFLESSTPLGVLGFEFSSFYTVGCLGCVEISSRSFSSCTVGCVGFLEAVL